MTVRSKCVGKASREEADVVNGSRKIKYEEQWGMGLKNLRDIWFRLHVIFYQNQEEVMQLLSYIEYNMQKKDKESPDFQIIEEFEGTREKKAG